ncbi:MAG: hypothetical protein QXX17_02400 [Conexivisphaerales archaeon]
MENFKYGAELPASKEVKLLVNKDQGLGVVILIASILGILIYGGLVFFAGFVISVWVLRITAFIAVAGVLAILAWIGYTLATTPPPQPIEELEKELQMSSTQTTSAETSNPSTGSEPSPQAATSQPQVQPQTQTSQPTEQTSQSTQQGAEDDTKAKEQKPKSRAKKTE